MRSVMLVLMACLLVGALWFPAARAGDGAGVHLGELVSPSDNPENLTVQNRNLHEELEALHQLLMVAIIGLIAVPVLTTLVVAGLHD